MNNTKFNYWFRVYLIVLFFFASFFLLQKYNNTVEWTISEWLINYQGGFTRRGFIGEIIFQLSKIFSITIRELILVFQISTCLIYYILIYKFLKNIKKNIIIIFSIFSPLFIIYPIAEVEVLARKEIFIFISFLLVISILELPKIKNKHFLYFSLILTITTLIWEGIIFYLPFFIILIIINNNFVFDKTFLIKLTLSIFPVFIAFYFIIFFKLTGNEIKIMCGSVNECYGAMSYLNNSLKSNISEVTGKFKLIYLFRYIVIFLVGFFPLLLLIKNSKFIDEIKIKNKNSLPLFILIFLPHLLFYYIAQDWGRWINISYTLSLLTYLYCYKKNFIVINNKNINFKIFQKKLILILLFIIFSFGWGPKTLINEDVGSIPIYRKSLDVIDYFF
jgi:hypothetical protein